MVEPDPYSYLGWIWICIKLIPVHIRNTAIVTFLRLKLSFLGSDFFGVTIFF